MKVIRLLGGAAIEGPEGPLSGREVQRARLALLALLAVSRKRSVSRERLAALLWPDSDTDRARGLLRDSVYRLREALGDAALVSAANELRLDRQQVRCDVWQFEEALERHDHAAADRVYAGPFLDGFFHGNSPDFEHWVDVERARLAALHASALESLAVAHGARAEWSRALPLWRRLAVIDPHSARIALGLMATLDAAGDRAAAIRHAAIHADLLRSVLDAGPDPRVAAFAQQLRLAPTARHGTDGAATAMPPIADHSLPERPAGTGLAPAEGELPPPPVPRAFSAWRRRARSVSMVAGPVVLVTMVASFWWYTGRSSKPSLDSNVVAVMPFRVTSADSANNYLREGVVDLMSAFLTNGDGPHAIDTRAVLRAHARERARTGAELTTRQMLAVARRLGAGRLLMGEIIAGPGGASMSARLLEVPSGRVVAQHIERGDGDYLRLATRVAFALQAECFGEASSRVAALSDSTEAVRAYLAGMWAYRHLDARAAFDHLSRALEIDPGFAPAALWRAYVSWGAFIFGTAEKRSADSAAWALRGRLSRRDSLVLASLPSIGPNYPAPSTARDLIRAQERAARANPDRAEVWTAWANHLITFGTQAEIANYLDLAESVIDSAIAIDATFLPALGIRMQIALRNRDQSALRKRADLYFEALGDSSAALHWRYAVAYALGDSERLPSLLARLANAPGITWQNIELWSLTYGLSSIQDAERLAELRLARARMPGERMAAMRSLMRVAAIRGRTRAALAWADSLGEETPQPLITLALLGDGYDSAATSQVRAMEARLASAERRDPEDAAHSLCYTQLFRIVHGDTSGTRRAIDRMRSLTSAIDAAPGWRVSRLDLCGLLLEAGLEQQRKPPASRSPALDRVERLVRQGPQAEQPGNLGRLLIAAWREAQGDYHAALGVVRGRDPMAWHVTAPASWRTEGRLAALTGDTAGAIRAYRNYLALRDQPDPGEVANEVQQVRAEVVRLERGRTRIY